MTPNTTVTCAKQRQSADTHKSNKTFKTAQSHGGTQPPAGGRADLLTRGTRRSPHDALPIHGSAVSTLHSTRTTTTRTRTAQAGTGLHCGLPKKFPRQQPQDQAKIFLDGFE